jgi:glycosyltransferase involved in cell wall biosynthesis
VITPSFNQGEFIEDTIKSVLSQDYKSIEYFVVDGGSTDNTLSILEKYDSRINWISEPDKGQSDAINKGWHLASGEVLAWLNSDDVYTEGAVSAAIEALNLHPEAGLVYGDITKVDIYGKELGFQRPGPGGLRRLLYWGQYITQPSAFIRADIIERAGPLDVNLNAKMDYDLFIRVAQIAPTQYLPRVQACFRVYPEAKSSTNLSRNWEEKLRVLRRYNRFWFVSGVFLYYLRFRFWQQLPRKLKSNLRKRRGLPRDLVLKN